MVLANIMCSNAVIKLQYSIESPLRLALQTEAGSGPKYVAVATLIAVALGGSAVVVYALYYDFVLAAATADP